MSIQYDPISPVRYQTPTVYASTSKPTIPLTKVGTNEVDSGLESVSDGNFESFKDSGIPWITLFAQLFGNIFNYFSQRKLQKEQQQFQYDFFDYTSNKQNTEYWKRVEYDTPFRQLQRLMDAGLSPGLMYGTLGNVSGASGNAPASASGGINGQIPTALPYFDSNSLIQAFLSPLQAFSQIGLNRSQSFKNYKSAGVDEQQANRLSLLTPYEVEKYQQDIDYVETMIGKAYVEASGLNIDNWVKEVSMGILARIKEEELNLLKAQVYATRAKGDYDNAAKLRMDKEREIVLPALAKSYNASAAEKWQNAVRLEKTKDSFIKEMSQRAKVTEREAETYFYREVLPKYLDLGIDATKLILSKGMSSTEFFDANGQIIGGKVTRK